MGGTLLRELLRIYRARVCESKWIERVKITIGHACEKHRLFSSSSFPPSSSVAAAAAS
jgi:hypothetical protein